MKSDICHIVRMFILLLAVLIALWELVITSLSLLVLPATFELLTNSHGFYFLLLFLHQLFKYWYSVFRTIAARFLMSVTFRQIKTDPFLESTCIVLLFPQQNASDSSNEDNDSIMIYTSLEYII